MFRPCKIIICSFVFKLNVIYYDNKNYYHYLFYSSTMAELGRSEVIVRANEVSMGTLYLDKSHTCVSLSGHY